MENATRLCADCRADISHRGNVAKRCTSCQDERNQSRRPSPRLTARTCEGCQQEYQPAGGLQRWCKDCVWDSASRVRMVKYGYADLERYRHDLATGTRTSTCTECDAQFTYPYKGGADRLFCDVHASARVIADRTAAADKTRQRRPLSEPRPCSICAKDFYATHPQQKYCIECASNKSQRARASRYGTSHKVVEDMKTRHGGLCWICREKTGTCVDHDHVTGAVRGWLCLPCNGALHYVERPGWWAAATAYLGVAGDSDDDHRRAHNLGDGSPSLRAA